VVPHRASGPADAFAFPILQMLELVSSFARVAPIPCTPRKSGCSLRRRSRHAKIECGSVNVAQIRRCVANRTLVRLCCSLCVLYSKGTTQPDEFTARIWRVPATRFGNRPAMCSARAGRKARSEVSASLRRTRSPAQKQGRVMAWAAGGPTAGAKSRSATRDKRSEPVYRLRDCKALQVAIPDTARRLLRSGRTSHLGLEELH
jgi:hypothetical protein